VDTNHLDITMHGESRRQSPRQSPASAYGAALAALPRIGTMERYLNAKYLQRDWSKSRHVTFTNTQYSPTAQPTSFWLVTTH